jgi:hypothetical protein
MRKLLNVLAVLAVLTIVVFALPAQAQDVFEVRIIECGSPGDVDGCGSNPGTGIPGGQGNRGSVEVELDGDVEVRLRNAAPNQAYCVFIGNWVTGGGFQFQYEGDCDAGAIGVIKTNSNGNYDGRIDADCNTTSPRPRFEFPSGTRIGQPNFAFNPGSPGDNTPCPGTVTHYTTGFRIP